MLSKTLRDQVLGLLEGKTLPSIREQLDNDYKNTMLVNWGVFVPAAVVNLAFCPPQLRVLFLNVSDRLCIGRVWLCIAVRISPSAGEDSGTFCEVSTVSFVVR